MSCVENSYEENRPNFTKECLNEIWDETKFNISEYIDNTIPKSNNKINIAFISSGSCYTEMRFVERIIDLGYEIQVIYFIDILYENKEIHDKIYNKLKKGIPKCYEIVRLCENKYTFAEEIFSSLIPIHAIFGIHMQGSSILGPNYYNDLLIEKKNMVIIT